MIFYPENLRFCRQAIKSIERILVARPFSKGPLHFWMPLLLLPSSFSSFFSFLTVSSRMFIYVNHLQNIVSRSRAKGRFAYTQLQWRQCLHYPAKRLGSLGSGFFSDYPNSLLACPAWLWGLGDQGNCWLKHEAHAASPGLSSSCCSSQE